MLMRSAGDFETAPTRRLDSAGCHLLDAPTQAHTQASFTKTPLSDAIAIRTRVINYNLIINQMHVRIVVSPVACLFSRSCLFDARAGSSSWPHHLCATALPNRIKAT